MKKHLVKFVKPYIYYLLSFIILIILYHIISYQINREIIFPKIISIVRDAKTISFNKLFINVSSTIMKAITAYIIALLFALLLAIISTYKKVNQFIGPYISMLKTIPTISIIIILLIWFGKNTSVYIIPILVIMPIMYEMFYHSLVSVNQDLVEVCQIYQFSSIKKIRYLYLYNLMEGLILSLKQTFGLCFKVIVMAEVIGGAKIGIGARIQEGNIHLEMTSIIYWTIILITIVLVIDYVIKIISNKMLKWR